MAIHIEIPFELLARPGVSKALSDLMILLGGQKENAAAPAVKVAEAVAAPVAVAEEAEAAPKRKVTRRAKPEKKERETFDDVPEDEMLARWAKYKEAMPENSRAFIALLEEVGTLRVDDAVEKLALKGPKALGGLTGAMQRWAPNYGVRLPFDTLSDDAGRYWVWKGFAR